ncbi:MAG: sugar ABC transporter permease [Clostridiales bacterium]|nr:sugar ABC transporter permease [Clostridiales bacterium]MDD6390187.1 sugar ABC transporter permease [Bacillota bacterium]MDY5975613.1 sugar ABC transporter permease [Anaerovoracaceae bacterium]
MYWLSKTRYKVGLLLPSILLYSVFIIIPIGMAVRYSFTKYSGLGRPEFTGFSNYIRMFSDELFWSSFKNTMIMFVLAFVLLLVLSFLIAVLLNKKLKGSDLSKALIFSPAIIAPIIVGIIWVYILDPNVGIINGILDAVGASDLKQEWIGGATLTPYSLAIVYFWQQLGYLVTIFIAGLKMLPEEVMEAAIIDGANERQKIIRIIIPMMKSNISTVAILIITGVFKIFEIVQQTTGGGPNHLSETLVTYSYTMTFDSGDYGYGMSLATVTFIISLIIVGLYSLFFGDNDAKKEARRKRKEEKMLKKGGVQA